MHPIGEVDDFSFHRDEPVPYAVLPLNGVIFTNTADVRAVVGRNFDLCIWDVIMKILLSAAAFHAVLGSPVFAQTSAVPPGMSADVAQQIEIIDDDKRQRTPAQRKIDPALLYTAREATGQPQFPNAPALRLPQLSARDTVAASGQVLVDIKTTDANSTAEQIRLAGGTVVSSLPEYNAVRASVPVGIIEAIAAIPSVTSIRPADLGQSNRIDPPPSFERRSEKVRERLSKALSDSGGGNVGRGSTISEAVVAHGADNVQNAGFTGAGVKICVMSNGVDTLAARQSSGNLPAVDVVPGQAGSGDEGTAMLELVADMAPGATLGYATAQGGAAQMATNIASLGNRGCDIIVDDWTYFSAAAFQEDVVANAVTTFTNTIAFHMFFSSAANSGRLTGGNSGTWEGDFADGGAPPALLNSTTGRIHSFGSAIFNTLTSRGNAITLKWADPVGGTSNDYDLYITNPAGTAIVASGTTTQSGAQDPYEEVSCTGTGGAARCPDNARIYIKRFSGSDRALRLDTHRGRLSIATDGSTFGHNGGRYTVSVAAVETPDSRKFTASDQVETYSSDGPRQLFINPVPSQTSITLNCRLFSCGGGNNLLKPDITAGDSVTTTTPGFENFTGTSAAAPNAAAIAALIKSRAPSLTAAQVLARMKSTALDNMATGWDRDSGAGIAMADAAVFGAAPTRARDFNADGRGDILWRNTSGDLSLWLMNGASASGVASLGNVSANSWSVVGQGDFNGDGRIDILWASSTGDVAIWFMNGTSIASVANLGKLGGTWSVVGIGDFNGDNKGDILWRNATGDLAIWFMNGSSVSSVASVGNVPTNWFVAAVARFSGIGSRSSILWRNTAGDNAIWQMNGASATAFSVGNVAPNWSVVGTADFNASTQDDILWRDTAGNTAIWMMNGPNISQVANLGNVPTNWSVVGNGDFNGDGKGDILWRNTAGDISMWLMNGTTASSVASLGNVSTNWNIQNANAN